MVVGWLRHLCMLDLVSGVSEVCGVVVLVRYPRGKD